MAGKKYYWLKLKKDFFKRHDIRILEGMENGHEMVLFYLKLLCESLDHDGALRFSEDIPYTPEMLAAVTSTDKQLVETALVTFKSLGLIEIEGGTILMVNEKVMVGCETEWAEKKRAFRDSMRTEGGQAEDTSRTSRGQCPPTVRTMSDKRKSIEKEKEKEKEKELRVRELMDIGGTSEPMSATPSPKRFRKPTVEEVKQYCDERKNGLDAQKFCDFYESKGWKVGNAPMKDWKAAVRNWERMDKKGGYGASAPAKNDVQYMQNTYSKEHLERREEDSLKTLDKLLEE